MSELDSELEEQIFMFLPKVACWIEDGEDICERDVKHLIELVPRAVQFAVSTPFEKIIEMDEGRRGDPFYGKYLEVLLSDKGKIWFRRNLQFLKDYLAAHN